MFDIDSFQTGLYGPRIRNYNFMITSVFFCVCVLKPLSYFSTINQLIGHIPIVNINVAATNFFIQKVHRSHFLVWMSFVNWTITRQSYESYLGNVSHEFCLFSYKLYVERLSNATGFVLCLYIIYTIPLYENVNLFTIFTSEEMKD